MALTDSRCANRVVTGAALGASLGGAVGAVYGTFEAFRYKVPGMYKIRYVGKTTVSSAAIFGLFLGAGSLLQCVQQLCANQKWYTEKGKRAMLQDIH